MKLQFDENGHTNEDGLFESAFGCLIELMTQKLQLLLSKTRQNAMLCLDVGLAESNMMFGIRETFRPTYIYAQK